MASGILCTKERAQGQVPLHIAWLILPHLREIWGLIRQINI